MAVGDAYVFPGFLTPVLTLLFFPKPPTTFLTCFCRGERRKYAGKKSRLNRGSNSQPPGHESDTFTTEPPWQGSPDEGCRIDLYNLKISCSAQVLILPFYISHEYDYLSHPPVTPPTYAFLSYSRLLTTVQKAFGNILGKGENAGNQHFLLFPQCFSIL